MTLRETLVAMLERPTEMLDVAFEHSVLLIGKLPPRKDGFFARAYLHVVHPGLNDAEIDRLEGLIGKSLPPSLRDFYSEMNGCSLFHGSLSVAGLRQSFDRSLVQRLPTSLEYGNTIDVPHDHPRPAVAPEDEVRFGFYSNGDGREVVCDQRSGAICLVPRYSRGPEQARWTDVATFLRTEVKRMNQLLFGQGLPCDPQHALPPPDITNSFN
ncbi:MAG: SMI1/KNR4 family protein [Lysobacteraceae bacterium]